MDSLQKALKYVPVMSLGTDIVWYKPLPISVDRGFNVSKCDVRVYEERYENYPRSPAIKDSILRHVVRVCKDKVDL